MNNIYFDLLKRWGEGLLAHQIREGEEAFQGGFLCPSCKMIHGRTPDAIYPLGVLYKKTGDVRYLKGAKLAFAYGKQLECPDGSLYNDAQAAWPYTTVFLTIAVFESLNSFGDLLDEEFRSSLLSQAKRMSNWLYENLDEHSRPNINYCTTNAYAMCLAGQYLKESKYLERSRHLFDYSLAHFSESGFFYGESKNHDAISKKGCRSIDMGYGLEESIPALVKCAFLFKDEKAMAFLHDRLMDNAPFFLPDGGLDNTFGVRNNKWTYYGSRTSDGISPAYLLFASQEPLFQEIAYRNTELLSRCTVDGLLAGGPDYDKQGEYPCIHHTFEHASAIAFDVDEIEERYLLKTDEKLITETEFNRYYPECDLYRVSKGPYLVDVTGFDFDIPFSAHASGGALTLLYGPNGPMIMGSIIDYFPLPEPTNQQLPHDPATHRPLLPRLVIDGYSSTYDGEAKIEKTEEERTTILKVDGGFATRDGKRLEAKQHTEYRLATDGLSVDIQVEEGATYILPLIQGHLKIRQGKLIQKEEIFYLTGGFQATEYRFEPENSRISLKISS